MPSITGELGVEVPMADGTILVADVVRPSGRDPRPTVVVRTPYNRRTAASRALQVDALGLAEAGYAVVIQDVRGRFGSGGVHAPFAQEAADGVDTIEWAAGQSWSDGRVAMAGNSYLGFCQLAAAARRPEPLRAIIPSLTACDVRTGWIREGGELNAGFNMSWMLGALLPEDPRTADRDLVLDAHRDPGTALRSGSDASQLIATSPLADVWAAWESDSDPYPDHTEVPDRDTVAAITAPALVIAGWYDVFQPSSFDLHRTLGASASLLVGPWGHGGLPLGRRTGERDHGAAAVLDMTATQRAFLDRALRDDGDGPDAVRAFVTGSNHWESFARWPPPGQLLRLFPEPGGGLEGTATDGSVDLGLDPDDPTPAVGGRVFPWEPTLVPGPFDQSGRDDRADVACFTTAPLDPPLAVAGPVELTIGTDPADGVVFATLSEVGPDGGARNVADGVGRVGDESTHVSLGHLAHVFERGHRIRLSVSFGAFPRFRWQPGNGRRTIATGADTWLDLQVI